MKHLSMLKLNKSYSLSAHFVAGDIIYVVVYDVDGGVHVLSERVELLHMFTNENRRLLAFVIGEKSLVKARDEWVWTFLAYGCI